MKDLKYELIWDEKKGCNILKALKTFKTIDGALVKKGDIGGTIEDKKSISQNDLSWVFFNSSISSGVILTKDSIVKENCKITGNILIANKSVITHSTITNSANTNTFISLSNILFSTISGPFNAIFSHIENSIIENSSKEKFFFKSVFFLEADIHSFCDFISVLPAIQFKPNTFYSLYKDKKNEIHVGIVSNTKSFSFPFSKILEYSSTLFNFTYVVDDYFITLSKKNEKIKVDKALLELFLYLNDCICSPVLLSDPFIDFLNDTFPEMLSKEKDVLFLLRKDKMFQSFLCYIYLCYFNLEYNKYCNIENTNKYIKENHGLSYEQFINNCQIDIKSKAVLKNNNILYTYNIFYFIGDFFYTNNIDYDNSVNFSKIQSLYFKQSLSIDTLTGPVLFEVFDYCPCH